MVRSRFTKVRVTFKNPVDRKTAIQLMTRKAIKRDRDSPLSSPFKKITIIKRRK